MTASSIDSTGAAEHFFSGAVDAGMAHLVLSPGSRSTPLAVAAERTPGLRVHVHIDERSAAFAALGQAKATGEAVGLVCTSGTAAANYLPAIAEASLSNISLIAVTADRPPEHQHVGIGQSFDQRGLFGSHVRDEITMPVGADGGPAFTARAGWRSVATALEQHGPVHVNWAFRLPLEPRNPQITQPASMHRVSAPQHAPDNGHVELVAELIGDSQRPLIIAGPDSCGHANANNARLIIGAAETFGAPVLADVLSGLRGHSSNHLIEAPALSVKGVVPEPDLIIRLGQTPTSKSTRLWWESFDAPHLLIDPLDDWHDPSNVMSARVRCSPSLLLDQVAARHWAAMGSSEWLTQWSTRGRRISNACNEVLSSWRSITEAHVASIVGAHTPSSSAIVVSSSMPVRDLDMFTPVGRSGLVLSNRGINGIDGVISTAIGVARSFPDERTVAYVGDVAALHDVGGILDAARHRINLTIVIPNNDGGGIFSFLPAKRALDATQFSSLFHTPHGTKFDFLGAHDGISYEQVVSGNIADVGAALDASFDESGVSIVEIPVSTPDRLVLRDALSERLQTS